ncbi:hypothetical protein VTJ83DRAFT_4030 [Remersonia thermophila]|uniref:CCHC-type domain-containing protein n=1 Tax=Remersonia thermophila TaxID=72144 RepID=A0ABR4DFW2_9PEZI
MSDNITGPGWGGGQNEFEVSEWNNGSNSTVDDPWNDAGNASGWNGGANDASVELGGGGDHNTFGGDGGADLACFNCGETGHRKADCPKPRAFNGACRRCNQEGHMSKDCPNAPPPECHECQSIEHLAKDCPNRICKNCGNAGHTVSQCTEARKIDRSDVPDMAKDEAWEKIKQVAKTRDIDDIKEAIQIYVKASPETTYVDLERLFRDQEIPIWLIAIERELLPTLTLMDLQGNLNKKYKVTYRTQWNATRPSERLLWPKDVDENLERLKNAGEPTDRMVPKCSNCGEVGHGARSCPQEKLEKPNTSEIRCYNCNETGHRVRDCPVPRVDRFACKNCGESGHKVADCPKPRSTDDVECRNCGELGHRAKDCPKPRDMSRVKCNKCGESGHFERQCTNAEVDGGDGQGWNSGVANRNDSYWGSGNNANGSSSGWEGGADGGNAGTGGWEVPAAGANGPATW